MPMYKDKRTGKWVIQFLDGYRMVEDKTNPGKYVKRPKDKSETVGRSKKRAKKLLAKRESEWEQKRYRMEMGFDEERANRTLDELVNWYLDLPMVKMKKTHAKDVERAQILVKHFGAEQAHRIKPSDVERF